MKIHTKLPINLTDEYLCLFKKKETYSLDPLEIKSLNNVFISHSGLIINHLLIPTKSCENLIGFYDKAFYFKHWKKAFEQFLVCKFGKSLKSMQVNDNQSYFTIHTSWFGYFSWLTTCLPRLIVMINQYPNAILLMPEEWKGISYVMDSLKFFPNLKIKIIPSDHHLFVKFFKLAETRPWTSIFYPEHIFKVRSVFTDVLVKQPVNIDSIKRIYVSRRKANRRKIINEVEIVDYLNLNGFKEICFEDYSVLEQVFLMQNVEILISMHGAGLSNTIFMQPNSKLLELTPIVSNLNDFRFPFWRIASIMNVEYFIQFCQTIDNGETDVYSKNIFVDLLEFKNNLQKIVN